MSLCISLSFLVQALLLGMCIPNFYKPLIVSEKSHKKADATTRYLETAALVYRWGN